MSRIASAQAYPSRPIRLIAPFPPGGSIDLTARLIGQWLTERLGQQFVIENRSGAAGNIGSETALNSPADGYTLLLCSVANAISATLYDKLNYNFRDVAPVAGISRAPNVMVLHPSVPAETARIAGSSVDRTGLRRSSKRWPGVPSATPTFSSRTTAATTSRCGGRGRRAWR